MSASSNSHGLCIKSTRPPKLPTKKILDFKRTLEEYRALHMCATLGAHQIQGCSSRDVSRCMHTCVNKFIDLHVTITRIFLGGLWRLWNTAQATLSTRGGKKCENYTVSLCWSGWCSPTP